MHHNIDNDYSEQPVQGPQCTVQGPQVHSAMIKGAGKQP